MTSKKTNEILEVIKHSKKRVNKSLNLKIMLRNISETMYNLKNVM